MRYGSKYCVFFHRKLVFSFWFLMFCSFQNNFDEGVCLKRKKLVVIPVVVAVAVVFCLSLGAGSCDCESEPLFFRGYIDFSWNWGFR
jgi:hypothetical protein